MLNMNGSQASSPAERVRIGLMSTAHIHADSYARALMQMPGVEFIGFSDDDDERAAAFASRSGARHVGDHDALLAGKPDGVLICSENTRHLPLVLMAASAGVAILCEKPLATTLEDAQAMLNAAQAAGVGLYTAFPMRFNAPVLEIKQLIASDGLGRIYAVNGTNQGECPAHHRAWFVDPALSGGGALIDHTVHLADLLRWMLQSEPTEVYAETNAILYHKDAPQVETGGLLSLRFANGTFATIDCSWSRPPSYPTWGGLTMNIIGERGVAYLDAFRQNLMLYRGGSERSALVPWGSNADGAMLADFVGALRGAASSLATAQDGLRAVAVVAAAYESARTGKPVAIA